VVFRNPVNNYVEEISIPWLWTLLFGPIYFAIKGIWTHFIAGILLGILTCGISWLFYPFFAKGIIRKHYLRKGWIEISGQMGTFAC
jgi:hypothetical protein